jgi:hypothetical protein
MKRRFRLAIGLPNGNVCARFAQQSDGNAPAEETRPTNRPRASQRGISPPTLGRETETRLRQEEFAKTENSVRCRS